MGINSGSIFLPSDLTLGEHNYILYKGATFNFLIERVRIMKVYGTEICMDCRNYKAIQKARGFEAEYIDITADTSNLKEFLSIRDTEAMFDDVKAHNGIGIPLFVNDDGRKTFDINEAFSWIGQEEVREEEIIEHRSSCGVNGCI